jgi:hypothetical protein
MNISVNHNAPVIARAEITIQATIVIVWNVLTTINSWPEWQKAITKAQLNGELKEGVRFEWKAGGLRFRSQVHTMQKPTAFGWTGKTIGANAIHNWTMTDHDQTTIVNVEESLQGILPSLFKRSFQNTLQKGMNASLEELKATCESKK